MEKRIIVVGAGLAGMVAALAAHEEGSEVVLIDRGSVGLGTNTALAGGVFTAPTAAYGWETYVKDTINIGRMLNSEPTVALGAQEADRAFTFLRSIGVPLTESHGSYAVTSQNLRQIRGITLVKTVAKKVRQKEGIRVLTDFYVTELLQESGTVYGIRGIRKDGETVHLEASAVVLAVGGGGAVYRINDNQKTAFGHGYRLTAEAGLPLWDMEFVQFYPLAIADPHLPSMILYPPFHESSKLTNASGEDILKKYAFGDINEAILKRRDEFSLILFNESCQGPVYMDCSGIPSSLWDTYPFSLLSNLKFDFRTRPFAISPAAHFFMGGVKTDHKGETALAGLFACGEVAWGFHGANRRGGNALTECLVMGRIAGHNAARRAGVRDNRGDGTHTSVERHEESSNSGQSAALPLKDLRRKIRGIAWEKAGVVRSEEGLKEGLAAIEEVDAQLRAACPGILAERKLKEDLLSASFVLKSILIASLGRKESRGSFQRRDYPHEDNVNWLKNSCLTYDPEGKTFSLTHVNVRR